MGDFKTEAEKIVLEILVLQPTLDTEKKYTDQLLQLHIQGVREERDKLLKQASMINVYIDENGNLKKVTKELTKGLQPKE